MSISPLAGQLYPSVSQSAGQRPHPKGECRMSKMNRPWLYWALDSIRTDWRPDAAKDSEVSAFTTAELSVT